MPNPSNERPTTSGDVMRCPNCGGPLTLVAPDKSERVTCPNCDSLLDVNQGNLTYLQTLNPAAGPPNFVAPIGAEGTFPGRRKVSRSSAPIVRSVTIEGDKYYWHEYLLYNPIDRLPLARPFRQPLEFCRDGESGRGRRTGSSTAGAERQYTTARRSRYFKMRREGRIRQGRILLAGRAGRDGPGGRLCRAAADAFAGDDPNEINWSLGTYMTNAEVEKIFGVTDLPKPWGVAPNQPFTGSFYYTWGLCRCCCCLSSRSS